MHRYRSSATKSDVAIEMEGPMTRKLALAAAIAVIALTSPVGIGTTEAHGFGGGGFHGGFGGFHGGGFHGGFGGFHRGFGGFHRGFGGFRGGFAPYYGYGGYYFPGCYGYGYTPYGCYGGYGY
jgi:hypothetical protein